VSVIVSEFQSESIAMTPLRILGIVGLVFVFSLPVTLVMQKGLPGQVATADADDELEGDDPVVDLYCLKGLEAAGDADYDKAIAAYTEAIKRDPKYSFAYLGRGDVYAAKGDLDRAIQDYDEAVRLEPDNAAAKIRAAALRSDRARR
jgi:tetratricopeptide (TPR) repeat protein